MMDFKTLALYRESCRAYRDTPVSAADLEDIVRTALLAPSARNLQPWHYHVCTGETAKTIAKHCMAVPGANAWAENCPAFIVISSEVRPSERFGCQYDYPIIDAGIAYAYVCLAAAEKGLGTCIIGSKNEPAIKETLGIPEERRVYCAISVGYPVQSEPREKKRESYETLVTLHG